MTPFYSGWLWNFPASWHGQTFSPVGFAAMPHAANLDGVGIWADEEEAVVAYA
jgi:hypothetical protein